MATNNLFPHRDYLKLPSVKLLQFIQRSGEKKKRASSTIGAVVISRHQELRSFIKLEGEIPEGTRDQTLFEIACYLFKQNWPIEEIEEKLLEINEACCEPPMDIDEVIAKVESASKYAPKEYGASEKLVCFDNTNLQFCDRYDEAYALVVSANKKSNQLFTDGSYFLSVVLGEDGRLKLNTVSLPLFKLKLSYLVDWYKGVLVEGDEKSEAGRVAIEPPKKLYYLMYRQPEKLEWPRLKGLKRLPYYDATISTLVTNNGYSDTTKYFLDCSLLKHFQDLSLSPSFDQAVAALSVLKNTLSDFPFETESDLINAIALLLTPFLKPFISGNVPLFLINAPCQGTGKTLLAKVLTYIACDENVPMITQPSDNEELRKQITTFLSLKSDAIIIDNVESGLKSPVLAKLLTDSKWFDRELGKQKTIELDVESIWLATGNNVMLNTDLARRTVLISLVAPVDTPWTRGVDEFKHPDILAWLSQEEVKKDLWTACYTIINFWISQGKPESKKTLGSFESWSTTLDGVFQLLNVTSFLSNQGALIVSDSDQDELIATIYASINEAFGDSQFDSASLIRQLDASIVGRIVNFKAGEQSQLTSMGRWLGKNVNKVSSGRKLMLQGLNKNKSKLYCLTVLPAKE